MPNGDQKNEKSVDSSDIKEENEGFSTSSSDTHASNASQSSGWDTAKSMLKDLATKAEEIGADGIRDTAVEIVTGVVITPAISVVEGVLTPEPLSQNDQPIFSRGRDGELVEHDNRADADRYKVEHLKSDDVRVGDDSPEKQQRDQLYKECAQTT